MDNIAAYNSWSNIYDTNVNRTRDLEGVAIRKTLENHAFQRVLEIGCGTGKNTIWFAERAEEVLGMDFSEDMLAQAQKKISLPHVAFKRQDIRINWHLSSGHYDLISFSLVLEHIEDLEAIFAKSREVLKTGGLLYFGELHPFKQYLGTKARFDPSGQGEPFVLECYTHPVSEYFQVAHRCGFIGRDIDEWYDDPGDPAQPPRILTMLFEAV